VNDDCDENFLNSAIDFAGDYIAENGSKYANA